VPVFPLVAVDRPALRLPSPGVADSRPDVVSLWDVDLDVVRRVCLGMVDAIPEVRRGLLAQKDVAAEKWAGREPRPAVADPDHPGSA
jgi:hypothetical protein